MSETTFEITRPTEGRVVLNLDWQDAEIVLRLVGLANTGNLASHSQNLLSIVNSLVEEFGRDNGEANNRYGARISNGQVYIYDLLNPPF